MVEKVLCSSPGYAAPSLETWDTERRLEGPQTTPSVEWGLRPYLLYSLP